MNVQSTPTSKLAVAALVLALLFCIPFAPLVGVGLGIAAVVRISRSKGALKGEGLAIAAIATGSVVTVFAFGVMMAVAIPNFVRYQLRSKTSEARTWLSTGKNAAMNMAKDSGKFPVSEDTGWVPARPCGTVRCQSDKAVWKAEPWPTLRIDPSQSSGHFFQYRYESDGTSFELSATADLDGDGEQSLFSVSGSIGEGGAITVGDVEDRTPGQF